MPTLWFLSALFGALMLSGTAASAQPRALSDGELRQTAAGFLDTYLVLSVINVDVVNNAVAMNIGPGSALANSVSNVLINNNIQISNSDTIITVPLSALGTLLGQLATNGSENVRIPTWIPWSKELLPSRNP